MLHDAGLPVDAIPSDPPAPLPYRSSGLPDDFHAFMSDVLRDEPPITEADLDAMWAQEMELRDADRELAAELERAIQLNRTLSDLLAEAFPGLSSSAPAA